MRHPFDVAWSPEASSSTPAFCSSSWYFAISPRIFSCGITPASESFVAFTTIMNRMVLSPLLGLRAQSLLLLLELRRLDQLLHLGERPVDHRRLAPGESDARALGARLQPLPSEHHARFLQLDVELPHFRQDLFVGEDPGL